MTNLSHSSPTQPQSTRHSLFAAQFAAVNSRYHRVNHGLPPIDHLEMRWVDGHISDVELLASDDGPIYQSRLLAIHLARAVDRLLVVKRVSPIYAGNLDELNMITVVADAFIDDLLAKEEMISSFAALFSDGLPRGRERKRQVLRVRDDDGVSGSPLT